MQKANLYIKDWLSIHPYTRQQPSDNYFVQLANRLFHICPLNEIPEAFKKKICLYTAGAVSYSSSNISKNILAVCRIEVVIG